MERELVEDRTRRRLQRFKPDRGQRGMQFSEGSGRNLKRVAKAHEETGEGSAGPEDVLDSSSFDYSEPQ